MKSIIGFVTSMLLLASSLLPQEGNKSEWTKGSYLDANGKVSKSVMFPASLGSHPEEDIFWQALVFDGTQLGKSNMTMLKLK